MVSAHWSVIPFATDVFSLKIPILARNAKVSHSEREEILLHAWRRVQQMPSKRNANVSVTKGTDHQPRVASSAIQDPEVMEIFAKNAQQILIQALIDPSA